MTDESLARYRRIVAGMAYKPGWVFKLGGPLGRMLCAYATTPDSLAPWRERTTQHMFDLPDVDLDDRAFVRWVFDRLLLAELHEAGEFFTVDGFAPFFPHHQDEGSPYELVDRWEMKREPSDHGPAPHLERLQAGRQGDLACRPRRRLAGVC